MVIIEVISLCLSFPINDKHVRSPISSCVKWGDAGDRGFNAAAIKLAVYYAVLSRMKYQLISAVQTRDDGISSNAKGMMSETQ